MINDAEKYTDEDKKYQETIAVKNSLESYAYNMRNTVNDEKQKIKFLKKIKK